MPVSWLTWMAATRGPEVQESFALIFSRAMSRILPSLASTSAVNPPPSPIFCLSSGSSTLAAMAAAAASSATVTMVLGWASTQPARLFCRPAPSDSSQSPAVLS